MPFVKAKSKYDNSTCSFEKDGMKCSNTWKKDEDYIWDTDGRKAYCTKHDDINSKIVEGGGKGGFSRGSSMPLCRPLEEAVNATTQFHAVVVPMIRQQAKTDNDATEGKDVYLDRIDFWTQLYLENFLGKLRNMGARA